MKTTTMQEDIIALREYIAPFVERGIENHTFGEHAEKLFGEPRHFFTMLEVIRLLIDNNQDVDSILTHWVAALTVAYRMGQKSREQ